VTDNTVATIWRSSSIRVSAKTWHTAFWPQAFFTLASASLSALKKQIGLPSFSVEEPAMPEPELNVPLQST
jgi:hypothetical protein